MLLFKFSPGVNPRTEKHVFLTGRTLGWNSRITQEGGFAVSSCQTSHQQPNFKHFFLPSFFCLEKHSKVSREAQWEGVS